MEFRRSWAGLLDERVAELEVHRISWKAVGLSVQARRKRACRRQAGARC